MTIDECIALAERQCAECITPAECDELGECILDEVVPDGVWLYADHPADDPR